jgi:hypothetical protein
MSLINDSILLLINVLHMIVIVFVLGAPFSDSNYLLFMHALIVPFILLHWVLNNNTCSLTVAEKYIRSKSYGIDAKEDECFTYQFIAPIYDFNKNYNSYSYFSYSLTIGLWVLTMYRLYDRVKEGKINSWRDISLM